MSQKGPPNNRVDRSARSESRMNFSTIYAGQVLRGKKQGLHKTRSPMIEHSRSAVSLLLSVLSNENPYVLIP